MSSNFAYKWFNGFWEEESKNIFSYGPLLKLCLQAEAIFGFLKFIRNMHFAEDHSGNAPANLLSNDWVVSDMNNSIIFSHIVSLMLNLSNRGGHLGFLTHTKSENKMYVIIHVQLKFHPVSSFQ